jgi:hypothetical protein
MAKKIILGIASIFYLVVFFGFIACFVLFSSRVDVNGRIQNMDQFNFFTAVMAPSLLIAGLLEVAVIVYFLINLFSRKNLNREQKLIWTMFLILFNAFALPVYWYIFIWKDDKQKQIAF